MPSVLGAVLAGGLSRRFGSDKAAATISGRTLLEHAVAALHGQCAAVVIVGRAEILDWPEAGRGPLGGIAGALIHAHATGFEAVLTCGVDSYGLPPDLLHRLAPAPACVSGQPVIGLWRTADLAAARAILTGDGPASVWRFAERIGARRVALDVTPHNLNTPEDLAKVKRDLRP